MIIALTQPLVCLEPFSATFITITHLQRSLLDIDLVSWAQ